MPSFKKDADLKPRSFVAVKNLTTSVRVAVSAQLILAIQHIYYCVDIFFSFHFSSPVEVILVHLSQTTKFWQQVSEPYLPLRAVVEVWEFGLGLIGLACSDRAELCKVTVSFMVVKSHIQPAL